MQYSIYPTRSPQGGGGFQNVAFLPLSNRTMLWVCVCVHVLERVMYDVYCMTDDRKTSQTSGMPFPFHFSCDFLKNTHLAQFMNVCMYVMCTRSMYKM